MDYREIGQRIRREREKLNITREKMAELIELSPIFIGQIERGERKMSLDTLLKLSNCLHLSLDYIIKDSPSDRHFAEDVLKESNISSDYSAKKMLSDKERANMHELINLIKKCSPQEILMITDVIKVILPYLGVKKQTT